MKGRKWDHERKDQLDDLASGRAKRMVFVPSKNNISLISTRVLCANWFLTTFTRGEGIVEILPWPGEPPERFTDESMQEKMTGVPAEDEREPGVKRSARRPPAAFAKQSPDDRRFRRSTGDARAIGDRPFLWLGKATEGPCGEGDRVATCGATPAGGQHAGTRSS